MRASIFVPLLVALFAPACTAEQKAIGEVKERITEAARDPDSLEFRNMRAGRSPDTICGEVNGRNAFGGMAGWTPFVSRGGRVIMTKGDLEDVDTNVAGPWDDYMCACHTEDERVAMTAQTFTCSKSP